MGEKKRKSYFIWIFGKPPEVVVELVSNKKGNEADKKLLEYASIGVQYYVLYDPYKKIQQKELKLFELSDGKYSLKPDNRLDRVGLSLSLWEGPFENKYTWWLRWCNMKGELIATGAEQSKYERGRAEYEREQAEYEREQAKQGWKLAKKLAAQLRALGTEPDE